MKARHPFCQLSRSKRLFQERCPPCIRQGRLRRVTCVTFCLGVVQITILDKLFTLFGQFLTFLCSFYFCIWTALRLTILEVGGVYSLFMARLSASALRTYQPRSIFLLNPYYYDASIFLLWDRFVCFF